MKLMMSFIYKNISLELFELALVYILKKKNNYEQSKFNLFTISTEFIDKQDFRILKKK